MRTVHKRILSVITALCLLISTVTLLAMNVGSTLAAPSTLPPRLAMLPVTRYININGMNYVNDRMINIDTLYNAELVRQNAQEDVSGFCVFAVSVTGLMNDKVRLANHIKLDFFTDPELTQAVKIPYTIADPTLFVRIITEQGNPWSEIGQSDYGQSEYGIWYNKMEAMGHNHEAVFPIRIAKKDLPDDLYIAASIAVLSIEDASESNSVIQNGRYAILDVAEMHFRDGLVASSELNDGSYRDFRYLFDASGNYTLSYSAVTQPQLIVLQSHGEDTDIYETDPPHTSKQYDVTLNGITHFGLTFNTYQNAVPVWPMFTLNGTERFGTLPVAKSQREIDEWELYFDSSGWDDEYTTTPYTEVSLQSTMPPPSIPTTTTPYPTTTTPSTTTANIWDPGAIYRAVPGQNNIYEVLHPDSTSKNPKEYVYSPSNNPENKDLQAAFAKDGKYYILFAYPSYVYVAPQIPQGTQQDVYVAVRIDGTVDIDDAIWAGSDRKFGTADDLVVTRTDPTTQTTAPMPTTTSPFQTTVPFLSTTTAPHTDPGDDDGDWYRYFQLTAIQGKPFTQVLRDDDDDENITYALKAGHKLPNGLTLSSNGVVSGIPTEKGTFFCTIYPHRVGGPPALGIPGIAFCVHVLEAAAEKRTIHKVKYTDWGGFIFDDQNKPVPDMNGASATGYFPEDSYIVVLDKNHHDGYFAAQSKQYLEEQLGREVELFETWTFWFERKPWHLPNPEDYAVNMFAIKPYESPVEVGFPVPDSLKGERVKLYEGSEEVTIRYENGKILFENYGGYTYVDLIRADDGLQLGEAVKVPRHQVTYNATTNGGQALSSAPVQVAEGNPIDLSKTATKPGWEFVGWNTNKDATVGLSSLSMGSGDVTLYAIYKKMLTATFIDYSSTTKTTRTATAIIFNNATSGSVTAPAQNAFTGWTSRGWSTGTAAIASAAASPLTISADTTYYGLYQRTITLSYNANGGSSTLGSQTGTQYINSYANTAPSSVNLTLAPAITRGGYAFSKWAKDSTSGTQYAAGAGIAIDKNTTMYAVWETVAQLANGTYMIASAANTGASLNPYSWTPVSGTFITTYALDADDTTQRWVLEKQSDGSYVIKSAYNQNLVLNVYSWDPPAAENKVSLWDRLSNGPGQKFYLVPLGGNTYKIECDNDPTLAVVASGTANGDPVSVQKYNANSSLHKWVITTAPPITTYTVTFDKQGGTGGTNSVTAAYNANMPAITPPTRAGGYTFAGYYDATSGGTQYYTASGAPARTWNKTSNATLYARWTAAAQLANGTYMIASAANTGASLNPLSWAPVSGTPITTYALDTNDKTQRWVLEKQSDNSYIIKIEYNQNLVLNVLSWSPAVAGDKVSLYTRDGDITQRFYLVPLGGNTYKIECANNAALAVVASGTWNEAPVSVETYNVNSSLHKWVITTAPPISQPPPPTPTYTVIFDKQGGTGGTNSVTVTSGANMPAITPPTRIGGNFVGYYDTTSSGTQYYTAVGVPTRTWNKTNATLYARWKLIHDPVRHTGSWWPSRTISFTFLNGSATQKSDMLRATTSWNISKANVNFYENALAPNSVVVASKADTYLGEHRSEDYFKKMSNDSYLEQKRFQITMNTRTTPNNWFEGVFAHELAHSVGLLDNPSTKDNSLMKYSNDWSRVKWPFDYDIVSVNMLYGWTIPKTMALYPHYDSVAHLTEEATDVVRVEILDERVEKYNSWLEEPPEGIDPYDINTVYRMKVLEAYQGGAAAGDILELRQMGGQLGDEQMVVADQVEIKPGEEMVMFLYDFRIKDLPLVYLNSHQSIYKAKDGALESVNSANDLILTFGQLRQIKESNSQKLGNNKAVLTDTTTGVAISAEVGRIPEGAKLNVHKIKEGKVQDDEYAKLFGQGAYVHLYDITLTKDGKQVQPTGSLTVKLPLPADYATRDYGLYYVNTADNRYQQITPRIEGGSAVFEADHFSVYGFVSKGTGDGGSGNGAPPSSDLGRNSFFDGQGKGQPQPPPKTGVGVNWKMVALMLVILLDVAFMAWIVQKNNRKYWPRLMRPTMELQLPELE